MSEQSASRSDDPHDTLIPGPTDDTAAGASETETARQAEEKRQEITGDADGGSDEQRFDYS